MTRVLVLPLLAAAGLSLAACSKEPAATADTNPTTENSAAFETAGDNVSAVDAAAANDTLPLDNAASLDAGSHASDNAADLSTGNAQ